jgi:adenylate cyclase
VLWCSDLRGFTSLAGAVEPLALIRVLNDVFDCQVPAIERHGGEVLKFIGDGLLAIFPLDAKDGGDVRGDADSHARRRCDDALEAASDAMGALSALNDRRAAEGQRAVRVGLALHVGDVAYGNIGGAGRLDFTCIGSAVNLASRLEGLTARLDRPVVASADFARLSTRPMQPAGRFDLKGVAESQAVFAFDDGPLARW